MARSKSRKMKKHKSIPKSYEGYHYGMGISLGNELAKEVHKYKAKIPKRKKTWKSWKEQGTQLGNSVL